MSNHADAARSLPGDRAALQPLIAEPLQRITRAYFGPDDAPFADRAAIASVREEVVAQLAGATIPPSKATSEFIDEAIRAIAWARLRLDTLAGRQAFADRMAREHGPGITRLAGQRLAAVGGNAAEGEQIAQEVLRKFYQQLHDRPDVIIRSPLALFIAITVNEVRDYAVSERLARPNRLLDETQPLPDTATPDPYRSTPEEIVLHHELRELLQFSVQFSIEGLSEAQQELFYLYYVLDLKLSEIGRRLNASKAEVQNRLSVLRATLRRLFGQMRIRQAFSELTAETRQILLPYLRQATWLVEYAIAEAAQTGWAAPWARDALRQALRGLLDAYVRFAAREPLTNAAEQAARFRAALPAELRLSLQPEWEPATARLLRLTIAYLVLVRHRLVRQTLPKRLTRSEAVAFHGYYGGQSLEETLKAIDQTSGRADPAKARAVQSAWPRLPRKVDRLLKEAMQA